MKMTLKVGLLLPYLWTHPQEHALHLHIHTQQRIKQQHHCFLINLLSFTKHLLVIIYIYGSVNMHNLYQFDIAISLHFFN